ncbi:MAG: hypothetical protein HY549_04175 [Elusimicrobia bacterium]|nr:hypothetical protein [Elusimicrobiota bacterium]
MIDARLLARIRKCVSSFMKSQHRKKGLKVFAALAVLYAIAFSGETLWRRRTRAVVLEPSKSSYFHYEFIEIRLSSRDPALRRRWRQSPPKVVVTRGGQPVTTIASIREMALQPDESTGMWSARWPCPWNAPTGVYELKLVEPGDLGERLTARPFSIRRRKPKPVPHRFAVLTLESVRPLRTMKVRTPDGEIKDWRGLFDWVEYIGADAFWVLAGRTPGDRPQEVWLSHNLPMIPELAKESRRRGIKFGVYVMCYLTLSSDRLSRYEYALDVQDGRPVPTRAISIRDPRRAEDVGALLERMRDIPEVDYLGLDYIRNPLGGYELVDDFYREMPVSPPPGWDKLSREERMVYFVRKKIMRLDRDFIDAWQWWRAHRVAGIVRGIKARLGDSKPLWAFTLTWDKGWHHGQDPVMMNDAGVDADALMLYEADESQFAAMMRDWSRYVRKDDVQLIVGDVIDWNLHQKHPEGPKEFYRRTVEAINKIHADGMATGVFFHDLDRALWGRLGPWDSRAWMDEARRAVQYFKASGVVAR